MFLTTLAIISSFLFSQTTAHGGVTSYVINGGNEALIPVLPCFTQLIIQALRTRAGSLTIIPRARAPLNAPTVCDLLIFGPELNSCFVRFL